MGEKATVQDVKEETNMIVDFMKFCIPVLPEEKTDYLDIIQEMENNIDPFIGFMPAIIEDLWPIFIMEDTLAKQFNLHSGISIYLIPYGAHDFWGIQGLNDIICRWYDDDEIDIGERLGMEIEETILLKSDDLQSQQTICVDGNVANAIYMRLSSAKDRTVHIVMLIDTPHAVWTEVVEKFGVKTDVLIDSHRGMGDWFDCVPLYSVMKNTSKPALLPAYYFKGKFISHNAPAGFSKLYSIPEAEEKHWCACSIYKANWNIN